jgi:glycosyltransferase involved in cell wall biosynthesis
MAIHPAAPPVISIVLPCHNEAGNLDLLFQRLEAVLEKMAVSYEVIAIDDGSVDVTYKRLSEHHERNPRIKAIRFARNFGKENAVTCGLMNASGQAVIIMDSDLQHPPEVLPELVEKWREGFRMVYAIRSNRDTDGPVRRLFSNMYYWLFHKISDVKLPQGAGDFRLLDRKVVDAVNALPERSRFMKGLMSWVGFSSTEVEFDVAPRHQGASSWSPFGLVRFAVDGLLSFSTVPLRIWTMVGAGITLLALIYLVKIILHVVIYGVDVPGYASIMATLLLLGGIQVTGMGILAQYIARIFTEVKGRPLYFIADQRGIDPVQAPRL